MRHRKVLRAVLACLLLVGCGNVTESLEYGEWHQIGKIQVPSAKASNTPADGFRTTILEAGTGREVKPGSAVRLRVTPLTGALQEPMRERAVPTAEVWLWIGGEDGVRENSIVSFGSYPVRLSVFGLREGAKLELDLDFSRTGPVPLPTKGFVLNDAYKANWRLLISSGYAELSKDWEYVELSKKGAYEFHVERVCDARLNRKEATLKQWGPVPGWGDSQYSTTRQGTLEWLALDIECSPTEKMRFEKGPAYALGFGGGRLLGWYESYEILKTGRPAK